MTQGKWTLTKEFRFEAAHMLPHHNGKCARLHGHSWKGKVVVEGYDLHDKGPMQGMVMDYGEISKIVNPFVETYLDHRYLNETTRLEDPTSEKLSKWIYEQLWEKIPGLVAVEIEETCTSSCTYGRSK